MSPTTQGSVRYERKFLPDGLSPTEVWARVRRHPALFQEVYPERAVNNLYFDTPALRHYHDHVNGLADRRKVRVRWYGALAAAVPRPVLELKERCGTVGDKASYLLCGLDLRGGVTRGALTRVLAASDLPDGVRLRMEGLEPCLGNRYRRRYFRSADGRARLTMDWGLELWDLRRGWGVAQRLSAPVPPVILELKYAPEDAAAAMWITNQLPFRLTRCSKYVLGIEAM